MENTGFSKFFRIFYRMEQGNPGNPGIRRRSALETSGSHGGSRDPVGGAALEPSGCHGAIGRPWDFLGTSTFPSLS